ncbi:hypothetical protein RFI_24973, partial [Reticulomyxa filosa]
MASNKPPFNNDIVEIKEPCVEDQGSKSKDETAKEQKRINEELRKDYNKKIAEKILERQPLQKTKIRNVSKSSSNNSSSSTTTTTTDTNNASDKNETKSEEEHRPKEVPSKDEKEQEQKKEKEMQIRQKILDESWWNDLISKEKQFMTEYNDKLNHAKSLLRYQNHQKRTDNNNDDDDEDDITIKEYEDEFWKE